MLHWPRLTYVGFFRPLGDRIPIGARFTASVESDPGAHSSSFKCVLSLFPGGQATGVGRLPPIPFRSKVKESVQLYFYSPYGPLWAVKRWNLPLYLKALGACVRKCLEYARNYKFQFFSNYSFTNNSALSALTLRNLRYTK